MSFMTEADVREALAEDLNFDMQAVDDVLPTVRYIALQALAATCGNPPGQHPIVWPMTACRCGMVSLR